MHNEYQRESSLRHKLKSSMCCFSGTVHAYAHHEALDNGDLYYNSLHTPKTPRTPWSPMPCRSWRKKSPADDSPEPHRGRSRCLLSRIGRKHHRSSQSADFSYDPSSYALNFEDDCRTDDEEFPFRDFASRLKPSPSSSPSTPLSLPLPPSPSAQFPVKRPVTPPAREIVGFS